MVNIHCSVHVYTDDTQQSDCAVGRHALLLHDYTFSLLQYMKHMNTAYE